MLYLVSDKRVLDLYDSYPDLIENDVMADLDYFDSDQITEALNELLTEFGWRYFMTDHYLYDRRLTDYDRVLFAHINMTLKEVTDNITELLGFGLLLDISFKNSIALEINYASSQSARL